MSLEEAIFRPAAKDASLASKRRSASSSVKVARQKDKQMARKAGRALGSTNASQPARRKRFMCSYWTR